jgi:hypothetical protein
VEGLDEVVEMEFTRELDADDVLAKLNAQAPIGIRFQRVSVVPLKSTVMPRRIVYCMPLSLERVEVVEARCAELMAAPKVWVERLRPNPKRLNIRPYLRMLHVCDNALSLDLWVTQTGTARADELLKLLDLSDLLDTGSVIARTTIDVHDEVQNPDPMDGPPVGPAETLPLEPAALAALTRRDNEEEAAAAGWGVSPAGPVVE